MFPSIKLFPNPLNLFVSKHPLRAFMAHFALEHIVILFLHFLNTAFAESMPTGG